MLLVNHAGMKTTRVFVVVSYEKSLTKLSETATWHTHREKFEFSSDATLVAQECNNITSFESL